MNSVFDITSAKWGNVSKKDRYDIAILPWGSTEPHNGHLPYCTDMLASQAIAFDVAEGVNSLGINAMVLPGIPLGSQNPGQTELPFCIHAKQGTQFAVLRDIVDSLERGGIKRLLIINGHGGNIFKGFIRDLACEKPEFLVLSSEWYTFIPRKDYFEESLDDHVGEQETSVMMHYYPELVDLSLAGRGDAKAFAISGLNEKVAWIPRNWAKVSTDTGIGNPLKASASKGKAYARAVVDKYVAVISDICRKPLF